MDISLPIKILTSKFADNNSACFKKNIPVDYISIREIKEFIQYLVGTRREVIEDYFCNASEDEIAFYYLKKNR